MSIPFHDSLLSRHQKRLIHSFIYKYSLASNLSNLRYKNTIERVRDLNIHYEEDIIFLSTKLYDLYYNECIHHKDLILFLEKISGRKKTDRVIEIMNSLVSMKNTSLFTTSTMITPNTVYLDFCDNFYTEIIYESENSSDIII